MASLPIRSQEPYRLADLESLYRTDFYAAPVGGVVSEAIAAAVDEYRIEVSKGQQLVFMNGVFSTSLSDVSDLASLEGVVAGHLGDVEGETLEQVCLGGTIPSTCPLPIARSSDRVCVSLSRTRMVCVKSGRGSRPGGCRNR